jgi:hypothetical protein
MATMNLRKMILLRINKLRKDYGGEFSKNLMRWQTPISTVGGHVYAYNVEWEKLDDANLLYLYEKLLIRHHAKM